MTDAFALVAHHVARANMLHGAARRVMLEEARITIRASKLPDDEKRAVLLEIDRIEVQS